MKTKINRKLLLIILIIFVLSSLITVGFIKYREYKLFLSPIDSFYYSADSEILLEPLNQDREIFFLDEEFYAGSYYRRYASIYESEVSNKVAIDFFEYSGLMDKYPMNLFSRTKSSISLSKKFSYIDCSDLKMEVKKCIEFGELLLELGIYPENDIDYVKENKLEILELTSILEEKSNLIYSKNRKLVLNAPEVVENSNNSAPRVMLVDLDSVTILGTIELPAYSSFFTYDDKLYISNSSIYELDPSSIKLNEVVSFPSYLLDNNESIFGETNYPRIEVVGNNILVNFPFNSVWRFESMPIEWSEGNLILEITDDNQVIDYKTKNSHPILITASEITILDNNLKIIKTIEFDEFTEAFEDLSYITDENYSEEEVEVLFYREDKALVVNLNTGEIQVINE